METNNKLREALELAKSTFETLIQFQGDEHFVRGWATLGRDAMIAALAEPVRNCEVGTAADWLSRFNTVCERCSGSDCDHRLFKDEEVCDCFARWLQMPYEEGVAK